MRRGWRGRIGGRRAGSRSCPSRSRRAWADDARRRRRSRAFSIASRRSEGSARRTSWRCSTRAGRTSRRCAGRRTGCARPACGDTVTYVVNRNINYTNICTYGCKFCAFSKGRHNLGHRDAPYDLDLEEIANRTARGVGARRHRGVPAGRHQARLHRPHLSRHRRGREMGGARHARACLLAAGGPHRRRDPQALALRLPVAPREARVGEPAGHGGRDPRRRGARGALPGQDQHRASGSR